MKKLIVLTMLLAVVFLFSDCQSAKDTQSKNLRDAPSEVVTSGKRAVKKESAPRSAELPHPPPPPPPAYGDKDVKSVGRTEGWGGRASSTTTTTTTSATRSRRTSPAVSYDAPEIAKSSPAPKAFRAGDPNVISMGETIVLESEPVMDAIMEATDPIESEAPPRRRDQPQPKARQLTAGEVNDFSKWDLWTDLSQEDLFEHAERWSMLPEKRYAVQVITQEGAPLTNTAVELQTASGYVLWKAKTDNTGKAELWNKLFDKKDNDASKIVVKHKGKSYPLKNTSVFHEGINTIQIPVTCKEAKQQVDIAFVVDATGSMGDEISYLKVELNDVIQRVKDDMPDTKINLGSVFYRDTGDRYLTRKSDFSTNISKTIDFIKEQNADGGGDYPEAADTALDVALNELTWSNESTSRLLFFVLDAPPHTSDEVNKKMQKLTRLAAEKGIRVIPVACSGIRKGTEYLMRALALATNGTYTFLTDHSGIGGSHIEPTTDSYKVELLNDLLVRIITQYSKIPDCNERYDDVIDDIVSGQQNQQIVWEYYPNPTKGPFTVQSEEDIKEVFVTDLNGKLLMRRTGERTQNFKLDIGNFPSGVYVVKCRFDKNKSETGRIVLVHDR